MSTVAPSKRSKLLAASIAFGAAVFVSKHLGATSFLHSAAARRGDADVVSMQRRSLLPAAAVGALAAVQAEQQPATAIGAAVKGSWKEVDGRLTYSSDGPDGKAAYSFQLPKDGSFYKSDPEQLARAGKDPTQIAVYERKDGAVLEVGPLPKVKNYMRSVKNDLIRPLRGQYVVKLEDGPTGGQFEFIDYPQAQSSGGAFGGERRTKTIHYWFTSVKNSDGEGALIFLEAPADNAGFDDKEKPKLLEIINSLRLEA